MAVKKYNELPQKFNQHVVMDVRTGTTYHSDHSSPWVAIMKVIEDFGPDEFHKLDVEAKAKLDEVMSGALLGIIGIGPQLDDGALHEVISIGHFETTGGRLSAKNMALAISRFGAVVLDQSVLTDEDHELARWTREHRDRSVAKAEAKEDPADQVAEMLSKLFGGKVIRF